MTTLHRSPALNVYVDGRLLPNVTGARVTRGFDQEMTTAQVTLSGNAPAWVKQGSQVAIRMGGTVATAYQRFFGYVGNVGSNLWTPSDTLDCGDALLFAKHFYPSSDVNLDGKTDEQIITIVFQTMGVPDALLTGIGGTGKIFSDDPDTPLVWPRNMPAFAVIEEVDQASLGWKTRLDPGGAVSRTKVIELPTADPAFTFSEGTDILSGTSSFELPEPNNEVRVVGSGGIGSTVDDSGANTLTWHLNPAPPLVLPMLRYQEVSATALSTAEVALWLLGHLNQNLVTVNFVTFRDELLGPDMTILTDATHLRLHTLFWLQNVVTEVTQQGQFRQQVQLVSSRDLVDLGGDGPGPVTVVAPFTGAPLPAPAPPVLPPGTTVEVSFSLAPIDKERVIIDGTEVDLFTVQATDTTAPGSGTVATRAWTASGPGVRVPSGDQADFVTGFTDLAGASISLTVTDSLGNTGSQPRDLDGGGGAPIRVKKLYAATPTAWEVFDGTTWRTETPGDDLLAIAPGPQAGAGISALRTTDDLRTPAGTGAPFTTHNVTAVWVEEDVNSTDVAAGSGTGQIAISSDGGATWTLKDGPGGEVRRIYISRFQSGELHLICAAPNAGYYTSSNNGDDWTQQRAGDFVELVLSHSRNVVVTAAGGLERAEAPGDAFTFPGSVTIVTAEPHIRQDRFVAHADDGSVYATTDDGGWDMEARVSPPDGVPSVRSSDSDGETPGLLYLATDTNLWKSLDEARTTDGWLILRTGAHVLVKHGIFTDAAGGGGFRLWAWGADPGLAYWDGSSWTTVTLPSGKNMVNQVGVNPDDGNDILIVASTDFADQAFFHSTDGGTTWTPRSTPAFWAYNSNYGFLGISEQSFLASQGGAGATVDDPTAFGTFRTDDGGATWTRIDTPGTNDEGSYAARGHGLPRCGARVLYGEKWGASGPDLHFLGPDGAGQVDVPVISEDGSEIWVFGSPNADEGWAYFEATSGLLTLDFAAGLHFVTATGTVDRSPLGPADITNSDSIFYMALDRGDVTIAIGVDVQIGSPTEGNYLWRSTDRGATWTQIYGPTPGWRMITPSQSPYTAISADGRFFVGLVVGSVVAVFGSADNGMTFSDLGCPVSVFGLACGG